ncbi:alkaline phosphatase family protein [Halococcus sediminicola]|uniref:sulfatase-like hydrolase/transferase n=1 Tax=Halococcus sediminicola TaxID=1264579 RepID=UPI0012ABF968|nr:sulfatase-like hydrolase/transferase [Halococcus sediminicola]
MRDVPHDSIVGTSLRKSYDWLLNRDLVASAYSTYVGAWTTLTSRYPIGTNIYEREWDLLILLDTCRVDALREVADDYEFLGEINRLLSVGSTSNEWIANTFVDQYASEISETAYVSANGYAERVLEDGIYPEVYIGGRRSPPSLTADRTVDHETFGELDYAWKRGESEYEGHIPPRVVTDRAIELGREGEYDHIALHYSQPHAPYTVAAQCEDRERREYEENPFSALRSGTDRSLVWEAYLEELRSVLDEVELLIENFDADTVAITADHGEAFGEYGIYGHLPGLLHPDVKYVPWVVTSGTDSQEYTPSQYNQTTTNTREHLEALGYI